MEATLTFNSVVIVLIAADTQTERENWLNIGFVKTNVSSQADPELIPGNAEVRTSSPDSFVHAHDLSVWLVPSPVLFWEIAVKIPKPFGNPPSCCCRAVSCTVARHAFAYLPASVPDQTQIPLRNVRRMGPAFNESPLRVWREDVCERCQQACLRSPCARRRRIEGGGLGICHHDCIKSTCTECGGLREARYVSTLARGSSEI